MGKHTPGPWSLSGDLIVGPPEQRPNPKAEPFPHKIAKLCWDFDGDSHANGDLPWAGAEANAQLIIAAPDLLKACKDMLEPGVRELYEYAPEEFEAMKAAIAKAEGK